MFQRRCRESIRTGNASKSLPYLTRDLLIPLDKGTARGSTPNELFAGRKLWNQPPTVSCQLVVKVYSQSRLRHCNDGHIQLMKTIILSNTGRETLVDDDIFNSIGHYNWQEGSNGYALRSSGSDKIYLHREITICPSDMQVDHKDEDRLNNLRANLQIVSQGINGQRRKIQSNNTSGYRGVTYQQGSWKAQIYFQRKRICLGCFKDIDEAAEAYNKAANHYFGNMAKLNVITSRATC